MADETREVDVWITLHDKATGELKNLHFQMGKVAAQAKKVGRSSSKSWKTLRRGMRSALRVLRRMAIASAAFASYMASKFVKSIISAGSEAERFALQLRIVSNSAKEAEDRWQWVRRFAARTPFYTQQVVKAFNILAAVGVKDAKRIITAVGNAAVVMNRDISQVSMAFVSLLRRTWRRLGVDLDRTGKKVRISTSRMRIETEKNIDAIREGLLKVLEVQFPDGMKKMESKWAGMVKIMASEWWEFRVLIAEAGIFNMLKSGLSLTLQWITRMREEGKLKEWAQSINEELEKTVTWFITMVLFVKRLIPLFATWLKILSYLPTILGVLRLVGFIGKSSEQEETEQFFEKIRKEIALWKEEIDNGTGAIDGANMALGELLSTQKELLGVAEKYAGATSEQQEKMREAVKILKDLEKMDATRAQMIFDTLPGLREFAAGIPVLAKGIAAPFLNPHVREGLRLFAEQPEDVKSIVKNKQLQTAEELQSQRKRWDFERAIRKIREGPGGPGAYQQGASSLGLGLGGRRQQLSADPALVGYGGEVPGAGVGITPRTARDAAREAGFTEIIQRGARQASVVKSGAAETLQNLYRIIQELRMNNNWTVEQTVNVDPDKLAEQISEKFKLQISESLDKLVPVVQNILRDLDKKATEFRAAEAQQGS